MNLIHAVSLSALLSGSLLIACTSDDEPNAAESESASGGTAALGEDGSGGMGGAASDCESDSSCEPVMEECDGVAVLASSRGRCSAGQQCFYDTTCSGGGTERFIFTCEEESSGEEDWVFAPSSCDHPLESCFETSTMKGASVKCLEGQWDYNGDEIGTNGRNDCPLERPPEGTTCDEDTNPPCAYACPEGGWVTHRCVPQSESPNNSVPSHWSSEGVCLAEGAGGTSGD